MKDFLRESDAFFRSRMPDVTRKLFYTLAFSYLLFGLLNAFGPLTASIGERIFVLTPNRAVLGGHVWQFVTYAFGHDGFLHFFFNLLGLFYFGPMIEEKMGSRRFGWFVFAIILSVSITQCALALALGKGAFGALGFSGVVFGLLVGAFVWYPRVIVYVMLVLPMPMRLFCAFFGAVMVMGIVEDFRRVGLIGGGTGHVGHLVGIFAGFVMIRWPEILNYLEKVSIPYILPKRRRPASIVNMGHPGRHSDPDDRYNDPHWRLDQ